MSMRLALARWLWPDVFEQRDELYQEREHLLARIEGMKEVHVIISLDQREGIVDPWEAHFSKEDALRRAAHLEDANRRAHANRAIQMNRIAAECRNRGIPKTAPMMSHEDRMALHALNGLGAYVGRARFLVVSLPVGTPDRRRIIAQLQANEAAAERESAG